jgi:hypothetical protein
MGNIVESYSTMTSIDDQKSFGVPIKRKACCKISLTTPTGYFVIVNSKRKALWLFEYKAMTLPGTNAFSDEVLPTDARVPNPLLMAEAIPIATIAGRATSLPDMGTSFGSFLYSVSFSCRLG